MDMQKYLIVGIIVVLVAAGLVFAGSYLNEPLNNIENFDYSETVK